MPDYEDPSHSTIHTISQTLAAKDIGCLLWGEHLLRTYGSSLPAQDYKFILEDHEITPGFHALLEAGYLICTGQYPCPIHFLMRTLADAHRTKHPSHRHPFPSKHVHMHSHSNNPCPVVIGLYRKSLYLPPPPPSAFADREPPEILPGPVGRIHSIGQFIYAHELGPAPTASRGGRFPAHLSNILIPSPMYLVEILITLGINHCRIPGARSIWTEWLMLLREAYLDHGRGLAAWDDTWLLAEAYRPVWREAIDAQISRIEQPVMPVWRDLAWGLVGVDVERAKRAGHWGFEEGMHVWYGLRVD
ncbi:hypothetical protein BDW62DRAFT_204732 [Aspergillus aurantiobrunneus]